MIFRFLRLLHQRRQGPERATYVGPNSVVDGNIETPGRIEVAGRVDGNVTAPQILQTAEGAVVGTVIGGEVRLAGMVRGNVFADSLRVEGTARLRGDVTYDRISIAAGATIDGRFIQRSELERVGSETQATWTEGQRPQELQAS